MSLEQAIQDNTAAIKALTAAWLKLGENAARVEAAPAETKVTAAGVSVKAASAAAANSEPAATVASTASSKEAAQSPADDVPSVEAVGKAVTKAVATAGRDAVVALLGEFGALKGSELPADKRAEFIARAEALPAQDLS